MAARHLGGKCVGAERAADAAHLVRADGDADAGGADDDAARALAGCDLFRRGLTVNGIVAAFGRVRAAVDDGVSFCLRIYRVNSNPLRNFLNQTYQI